VRIHLIRAVTLGFFVNACNAEQSASRAPLGGLAPGLEALASKNDTVPQLDDELVQADGEAASATKSPKQNPGQNPGQNPEQNPGQNPAQNAEQNPGQTPGQQPTPTPVPSPGPLRVLPNLLPFANDEGAASTFTSLGSIDLSNAFFRELGTNGRSCVTCHDPRTGWSITPSFVRERFLATGGLDPIFRSNDGSVSPQADVSTVSARAAAYNMLLTKGLIRVGLRVPPAAEFDLVRVEDPYNFASPTELSLFRRPLPTANLRFLTNVMWDGRESVASSLSDNLKVQANNATVGHGQGAALSNELRQELVDFETSLFAAQSLDRLQMSLSAGGAMGGPQALGQVAFVPGVNDPRKPNFNFNVFSLYTAWLNDSNPARQSVARGEVIFNRRPLVVQGVGGLNDLVGAARVTTTCSGCHNTPNVGSSSIGDLMDLGLAQGALRTPDMPLYTLRHKATGTLVTSTDPGRALVTGRWADMNRFKVPGLRNLAARAPFFHNGTAPSVSAVVDFYNRRFGMGLSTTERRDLEAFLNAL